ncbi:hypothetical protein SPRG_18225, partial [Saprolegnia parasitica CBS 223.65]
CRHRLPCSTPWPAPAFAPSVMRSRCRVFRLLPTTSTPPRTLRWWPTLPRTASQTARVTSGRTEDASMRSTSIRSERARRCCRARLPR